jgi:hypothetical protein
MPELFAITMSASFARSSLKMRSYGEFSNTLPANADQQPSLRLIVEGLSVRSK